MSPLELPFLKRTKDLPELEEENERLEAEDKNVGLQMSIAQKRKTIDGLKARGLSMSHFGNSFQRAVQWLKSH